MIGEKLGPFRIEDKLGQGAMGIVYRAIYEATGQPVAIKVVTQEHAAKSGNSADRFQRESDILKQFRHPNIVQHIGVGHSKTKGVSYYAMEFVPGRTLEQVLEERGSMPWTEVVDLGLQICNALQYAHERGVVHRDLKPSNLLLTQKGQIKLTDFGIAKDLDRTALTATGRTLGTAAYMAPEQIRGTPEISHKTDLYALGCVLYQMLTGVLPFEGKSAMVLMHKHLEEPAPRPSGKNPQIPLALDKLVVRLMAKERDERPWDAQAVATALSELLEKSARKEEVPMVFGKVPVNPPRAPASTEAASPPSSSRTASATKSRKRKKSRPQGDDEALSIPQARHYLETGLLAAALLALGGLLAYLLWPPSAAYLYRQAKAGMASTSRSDWDQAKRRYIDELERRFPDHPYKVEVERWKDQILLEQARGRARFLENPNILASTEPSDDAEAAYQRVYLQAAEGLKAGQDESAFQAWTALTETLQKHPEDRKWYLLARERAEEQGAAVQRRLETVLGELAKLRLTAQAGRGEEARKGLRDLINRYGRYESVRVPMTTARLLLDEVEAPAATPGAAEQPEAPAP